MIRITIYQSAEHGYRGFLCKGHAGYADSGEDIVCAAVSVLVINTVNSIERFGGQPFTCETEQEDGVIDFRLKDNPTAETKLLLDSMVLGLTEVEKDHKQHLKLNFKEV